MDSTNLECYGGHGIFNVKKKQLIFNVKTGARGARRIGLLAGGDLFLAEKVTKKTFFWDVQHIFKVKKETRGILTKICSVSEFK